MADRSDRLAGRVALVTGAGNGIGQACALALARHRASVVVNDWHRRVPVGAVGVWNRYEVERSIHRGDHRTNPPWSLAELDQLVPEALFSEP